MALPQPHRKLSRILTNFRDAGWHRLAPLLTMVVVTVCVLLWGRTPPASTAARGHEGGHDAALWATFVDDLAHGKPYYETAVADYHARGYPTFTVANFRQPMLYQSLAWLGVWPMALARGCLVLLLLVRVWQQWCSWLRVALVAQACLFAVAIQSLYFAETWGGVIVLLSLLAAMRGETAVAVAWAFVGLSLRELVAVYVLVMVGLSLHERRWRDLLIWGAGIAFYLPTYAIHAQNALRVMPAGEATSYSYWYFGGIPLLIRAVMFNGLLPVAPWWMAIPVLTVLVLAVWRVSGAMRWTGLAYAAFFMVAGQPFNYYWGAIAAPVFACWVPIAWQQSSGTSPDSATLKRP